MTIVYPHPGAVILDTPTFVQYGGLTGTATAQQLDAAYRIAEMQMSDYLHTLLWEATVTGTYTLRISDDNVMLEYAMVTSVDKVEYFHITGCAYGPGWVDGQGYLTDGFLGVVQTLQPPTFPAGRHPMSILASTMIGCTCDGWRHPRIVWKSGYPTGTFAGDPTMLLGLTSVAGLVLNEMLERGGEGPVGIKRFSSLRYSEERTNLRDTPFGSTAKANWIANLVKHYRVHRSRRI